MGEEKKCPLFRKPESLSIGKGIGCRDFGSRSTTREGDVNSCERPDALRLYLRKNLEDSDNKNDDAPPVLTFPILSSAYDSPKQNE